MSFLSRFPVTVRAVLAVVALLSLNSYHPYPYDNVVTRWALVRQLAVQGTLRIDPYSGMTSDRAMADGKYFCDKAVLGSLAGAAVYAPLHLLGMESEPGSLPVGGAGRYLVERVLAGGSLLLLLILLGRNLRSESLPASIPVLALGIGSILLPYSTLLYGHLPAAMLIFASYHYQRCGSMLKADIAGVLASAFEFPVLLLYLIFLAYRRRRYWKPGRAFRIPLLLLCAFLPQLIHNWIAFGSPFTLGYSLETAAAFSGMREGIFGFTRPHLDSLYLITLSPERGLLFYMPWIALGLAGFFVRRESPWKALGESPLPVCVAAYVLLFSAYYMPTGGWAFGPRHLIPVVPFVAVGLARFIRLSPQFAFAAWLLVLPAAMQALLGTLGEVHLPVHPPDQPVPFPQMTIAFTMLRDGHHSSWLMGDAGTVFLALGGLITWVWSGFRNTMRVSWRAGGALVAWGLLILLSPTGWGGKIDYYRGVLAEHRREYGLAVEYYRNALEDPSAPTEYLQNRLRSCEAVRRNAK